MRVCNVPGCPTLTAGRRCEKHAAAARRRHSQATAAYSTKGHKRFRAAVLARDPLCVLCRLAPSTVADHYPRSRADLEQLRMDPDNPKHGRGLCAPCHSRETARLQPGGWNARQDA